MRERGTKPSRFWILYAVALFLALVFPASAWAVQHHGGAEGLVSHQIGHILFIAGMLYLLYRLRISSPHGPGWLEFKLFVWTIIFWNVLTFYGHWHMELIDQSKMIHADGHTLGFRITGPMDVLFYFSRLDHLLLLPAFLLLLTALIRWRKQS